MKKLVGLISVLIFMVGCSSTVDKQKISQIQSVAVVGFSVNYVPSGTFDLIAQQTENKAYSKHLANDFYNTFTQSFANKLKVKVIDADTLTENSYYQQLVNKYGKVEKFILSGGKTYRKRDMLTGTGFFKLLPSERQQLALELGVDSVIGLEALVGEGDRSGFGLSVSGLKFGSYDVKYRVTIDEYQQYGTESPAPIAEITNLFGETPEQSFEKNTAFNVVYTDDNKRNSLIAAVDIVAINVAEELTKQ